MAESSDKHADSDGALEWMESSGSEGYETPDEDFQSTTLEGSYN